MSDQAIDRNKRTKTIPWELAGDVLKRLPVKDVVRFKCVSKGWFSQINDPGFVKRHTNRSTINAILKDRKTGKLFAAGFDDFVNLENPRELNHPFTRRLSEERIVGYTKLTSEGMSEGGVVDYTEILGSCNGLVLLVNETYKTKTMVLWNMSTGDYKVLPYLPAPGDYNVEPNFPMVIPGLEFTVFFGFGYDSVTDDYKVMRIVQQEKGMDISEVRVYSLKANAWKGWSEEELPDDYYFYPYHRKRDATYLNGALHWVVRRKEDGGTCIIAFKVGTKEYDEIEILEYMKDTSIYCRLYGVELEVKDLGVLGGCLCMLSCCASGLYDELWMMKDYGVEDSWTCLFRIDNRRYGPPHVLHPIAYSKDCNKILLATHWYHIQDDDKVPTSPKLENLSRDSNFVPIPQFKKMNIVPVLSDICVGSLVQLGG